MRVLLDECLPERLKDELPGHQVFTAREAGLAAQR
jgi:predicted nuclease of predicted toxin-antitoxin system